MNPIERIRTIVAQPKSQRTPPEEPGAFRLAQAGGSDRLS